MQFVVDGIYIDLTVLEIGIHTAERYLSVRRYYNHGVYRLCESAVHANALTTEKYSGEYTFY